MKKILIISTNAIGDTYLSMSAIPILRENLVNCEISFLITKGSRFLFEDGAADKVIVIEKNFPSIANIVQKLWKINYDYAFSFFPGTVNTFFLKTLKSQNRSGFYNFVKRGQWFDKNQKGFAKTKNGSRKFVWQRNENYLELMLPPLFHTGFTFVRINKYKFGLNFVSAKNKIVLHPFSRDAERSLLPEQVKAVADFWGNKGRQVAIIGDEKINELRNILNNNTEFIVKPSLKTLLGLVNSGLFIGVDSFPLHVADAYSSNFIGLFSITNPNAVLTNSGNSIVFDTKDLRRISPEQLIEDLGLFIKEKNLLP